MSGLLISTPSAYATSSATGFSDQTGEETGFTPGDDYGTLQHPHCLEVTDSSYSVTLSGGTFTVGGKSYSDDATLTWSTSATYYVDEDGTYTTATFQNGCDLGTRGDPISASVDLEGSSGANHGISCSPSSGNYARDAANSGMHITVHFSGNCTVTNGTSATESVSATFTGQLHPCDGITCDPSYIDNGAFSLSSITAASATGEGEETAFTPGDDYGTGAHPHCLEVTASSYSVALSSGTFTVGGKSYSSGATLTWSTDDTYWVDEDGTYAIATLQTGCDLSTRGDPISATVDLEGSTDANHGISCSPTSGDYARDAANSGMHVTVHFSGNCTVTDGAGNSGTASVSATFTGLLHPCDGITCDPSYIDEGDFSF